MGESAKHVSRNIFALKPFLQPAINCTFLHFPPYKLPSFLFLSLSLTLMNSHISRTGLEIYEMALLWTDLSLLAQQRTKLSQNRNQLSCFYKNFRILWNVLFSPPFPTREKNSSHRKLGGNAAVFIFFFSSSSYASCVMCVCCVV